MTTMEDTKTAEIAKLEAQTQSRLSGRVRDQRLIVRGNAPNMVMEAAALPVRGQRHRGDLSPA